uniref:Putative aminotransferase n=1 Tax=Actinomadura melliaura TaxID=360723 RepID=UPI0005CDCED9
SNAMIPLFKVAVSPTALDRVAEVFASGYLGQGPRVAEFESALAARLGNPRVVSVHSGTSGLCLALRLLDAPEERDEVLSTPLTFEATNWAILADGRRITWVDVDPATLTMDLDDLERKISPATRAIIVVHWTGYPVDLDRLAGILDRAEREHGFRPAVIEDCAHAWGASYRGVPLGSHGNMCVFSFQALKHLTCGDGGLLTLPGDELHERAMLRRFYGIDRTADRLRGAYDVAEWGLKWHMTDLNAAIGLANLETVDEQLRLHRENAAFYDKELTGVPGLELLQRSPDREGSFYVYDVKVDDRPAFHRKMEAAGIMAGLVSRRNDEHSCVAHLRTSLPGLDSVYDRMVSLPVGWWLTEQDREHVVATIRSGW